MKIGVVDIDTSHPQNWIPIERTLGHDVAGLWDGGSVHPPEYVQQFAADHGIPRVFESLEEMAGEVDCAIIHLSLIHISEPTRLLSISYAVFCLKKKNRTHTQNA